MDKKDNRREGKNAIELAILNGIEAYNREQAKKTAPASAPAAPTASAHTGETRTKEAMEEAGLKNRRRSRAKGKGTKIQPPKTAISDPIPTKSHAAPQSTARKARLL